MKSLLRVLLLSLLIWNLMSCSSAPKEKNIDDTTAAVFEEESSSEDEGDFEGDFEEDEDDGSDSEVAELEDDEEIEESFEEELGESKDEEEVVLQDEDEGDDLTEESDEEEVVETQEEVQDKLVEQNPVDEVVPVEEEVVTETQLNDPVPMAVTNVIKNIRYKSQNGKETVVIETSEPAVYQTRMNDGANQLIIEVAGANLPGRLKRPFNTSQFGGGIGVIQAYQRDGSSTARVVVQLSDGVSAPEVIQEGNALLVVGQGVSDSQIELVENREELGESSDNDVVTQSGNGGWSNKILPAANLDEFLAGNTRFYGKKISLQSRDVDVRDVLGIIAEESGANLVISDDVSGQISIKLRDVPWDQALVMIMKAKALAYSRSGNILRIALAKTLRREVEEADKILKSKAKVEDLKVSVISVSYAKIKNLIEQIKPFLGERGKIAGDERTSSLIVTDVSDSIKKVKSLVKVLDIPPQQVLIEGKIIEARETFGETVGVNWGLKNGSQGIGTSGSGVPINMQPSLSVNTIQQATGALTLGLKVGKYDLLGNIEALFSLHEQNENIRVLSSPSILTLNNRKASIKQTLEIPYFTTNVSESGVASTSIAFKAVELRLEVEPQITADNSILLGVDLVRQFPGARLTAGGSAASAIHSRSAKTDVMVRNGQTAVFGGIYQNDYTLGETGVPLLKDIPFLGALFRTKNKVKEKTELLLFLTPRIVQPDDLSKAPQDLLSNSNQKESESL